MHAGEKRERERERDRSIDGTKIEFLVKIGFIAGLVIFTGARITVVQFSLEFFKRIAIITRENICIYIHVFFERQ